MAPGWPRNGVPDAGVARLSGCSREPEFQQIAAERVRHRAPPECNAAFMIDFVTMAGHLPGDEIGTVHTGELEREKRHEELLTEQEAPTLEVPNRTRIASSAAPPWVFEVQLGALRRFANSGGHEGVLRLRCLVVPSNRAGCVAVLDAECAAAHWTHGVPG